MRIKLIICVCMSLVAQILEGCLFVSSKTPVSQSTPTSGQNACDGNFDRLPDGCLNDLIEKLTMKDIVTLRSTSKALSETLRRHLYRRAWDRAPAVIKTSYSNNALLENDLIARYLTVFQRYLGREGLRPYVKTFKNFCTGVGVGDFCKYVVPLESWGLLVVGSRDKLGLIVYGARDGEEKVFQICLNEYKTFRNYSLTLELMKSLNSQEYLLVVSGMSISTERSTERSSELMKALVKLQVDREKGLTLKQVKILPGPHEYNPLYQGLLVRNDKFVVHQGKMIVIGKTESLNIEHTIVESALIKKIGLDHTGYLNFDTGANQSTNTLKRLYLDPPYTLSERLGQPLEQSPAQVDRKQLECSRFGMDLARDGSDSLRLGVRQGALFAKMIGSEQSGSNGNQLTRVGDYGDVFTHLGEATPGIWYLVNIRGELTYINGWHRSSAAEKTTE
jgi:hypothetical protein